MNYVIFDVETTTANKGNPYDRDNRVVLAGVLSRGGCFSLGSSLTEINRFLSGKTTTIVGFNLKFDLTWARRYGILLSGIKIHDCQLAHFLLSGQSTPYPSLDGVCELLNLGRKEDKVKQYWVSGIDTPDIPKEILEEYLLQDLRLTEKLYLRQMEAFNKNPLLYKLFQLQCEDLLTLLDMEWNGLVVDVAGCKEKEKETEKELKQIDQELNAMFDSKPINFNSNDHLSCILYGGSIPYDVRVPIGEYKTGLKAGQTKYKKITYTYDFPRLVDPPKGSELAKEGYYSTAEDILRNLTGSRQLKKLVGLLLTRSRLEKLRGTYLVGWPEQLQRSNSFDGRLHGQFNQVVARTGRLSSSAPNLQNADKTIKRYLPSRYQ